MRKEQKNTSATVRSPQWPTWAPRDLIAAFDAVTDIEDSYWRQPEELKELHFGAAAFGGTDDVWLPIQYLVGIGSRAKCLSLVELLGTDLRMRDVWERLAKLADEVRTGKLSSLLYPDRDLVACRIARVCAQCLDNSTQPTLVTRQGWGRRHKEIATVAKRLAQLLAADPCTDAGFLDARFLFTKEEKNSLAAHLYYAAFKVWDESQHTVDRSDELPPELSEEEIAADEEQVGNLEYWLDDALKREAPRPSVIIERLADAALTVAKNPPFVPTGDGAQRYVFLLSGSLMVMFDRWFRSPLDELVATIASVTSSEEVSTDSVKMRRNRWRKHYTRALNT